MPPPNRQTLPTSVPTLQWLLTDDGSRTLWDTQLDETYHSGCGAVAESLVVYLENSGTARRLADQQATRILEYGFGTATAFLLTAALAECQRTSLSYVAVENRLLPADILEALQLVDSLRQVIATGDLKIQLPSDYTATLERLHSGLVRIRHCMPAQVDTGFHWFEFSEYVSLGLWIGDACLFPAPGDAAALGRAAQKFDAVYFDPFSPATHPEMWTTEIFERVYNLLSAGGTLTSYCVKSSVRRGLESCGFTVRRMPGPVGGKREVLWAERPG